MRSARIGATLLLLAMGCAYCAANMEPSFNYTNKDMYLGGPHYRVFDAEQIDSIDEAPTLRALFDLAKECTGVAGDPSFKPVRVFTTSRIEVKNETTGKWISSGITGVWARGTPWVYVTTGRTPEQTARTILHEYVHYLTKLGHRESDDLIEKCNESFTKAAP